MARPYVITHNIMSLDGHIHGFWPDVGLYYETAAILDADCVMTGSDMVLKTMEYENVGPDTGEPPAPIEPDAGDDRPALVITDSRGRINTWQALCDTGSWRELYALVSHSTPPQYLDYLDRWHVKYVMAGDTKVDMHLALEELGRLGIRKIRTDSCGTINGVLLRQGLVDEISVLLHPAISGGAAEDSIFRGTSLSQGQNSVCLHIISTRRLINGIVWLRYRVER